MRVSALEGHRVWASFYDIDANPLLALERRSMANLLETVQPKTVIDIACGSGRCSRRFQQPGVNVFGVDFCERMLIEAMRLPSLRGRVALGNAERLPFRDAAAELVLCSMALGYFQDLSRAFPEFARVAVQGAVIAVSDLHPNAVSAGWTRSFMVGGVQYEMDHHCRSLDEIDAAAETAGLRAICKRTAYFEDAEYSIFQAGGKADRFAEVKQTPALFLAMWENPC